MNNTLFLARKTAVWGSAYLSSDFCDDLKIQDSKGKIRKFYKILWDYIPDSDPEVLRWAGREIKQIAKKLKAEIILGLESSGIAPATSASLISGLPFGFVRKASKGYGLERLIEGEFGDRKRALLVDNFVFTGTTLAKAAKSIKDAGLKLVGTVAIDNFDTLPKDPDFKRLPFKSLVKNSKKIKAMINLGYFPSETKEILKKYVDSPELFFDPSPLHSEYVRVLSQLPPNKCIVFPPKVPKRKPLGLKARIYRELLKAL
jgi:orotate phosphoribosyltransferase